MRTLIVKFFALDYIVKIGNKKINFVRASNILFPLFCWNGYEVASGGYIYESTSGLISFFILLIAIYFGFFYFKKHPVKFYELDKSQKWQFGQHTTLGGLQGVEWQEIDRNKDQYIYRPFWVALINPVLIITIILIFII